MTLEEALNQSSVDIEEEVEEYELVISPITRVIHIPENEKIFGVSNDENSGRKFFRCPRFVGRNNTDLSKLVLFINFQNANGDKDAYPVQDVAVDGNDITFSWELIGKAVAYHGDVRFIVCAKKSDDTRKVEWNTTVARGQVLEGLETTREIEEENAEVLEQVLQRVEEAEQKMTTNLESEVEKYMKKQGYVFAVVDGDLTITYDDGK